MEALAQFGNDWTKLEQQIDAVSWTDLGATIGVKEIDVPRQDKAWKVHDSALTLAATSRRKEPSLTPEGSSSPPESSLARSCLKGQCKPNLGQNLGGRAGRDGGHCEMGVCRVSKHGVRATIRGKNSVGERRWWVPGFHSA